MIAPTRENCTPVQCHDILPAHGQQRCDCRCVGLGPPPHARCPHQPWPQAGHSPRHPLVRALQQRRSWVLGLMLAAPLLFLAVATSELTARAALLPWQSDLLPAAAGQGGGSGGSSARSGGGGGRRHGLRRRLGEEGASSTAAGTQQEQPGAGGQEPPVVWLYTLLGADYEGTAELLPHWLRHYLGTLGFSKNRLLVGAALRLRWRSRAPGAWVRSQDAWGPGPSSVGRSSEVCGQVRGQQQVCTAPGVNASCLSAPCLALAPQNGAVLLPPTLPLAGGSQPQLHAARGSCRVPGSAGGAGAVGGGTPCVDRPLLLGRTPQGVVARATLAPVLHPCPRPPPRRAATYCCPALAASGCGVQRAARPLLLLPLPLLPPPPLAAEAPAGLRGGAGEAAAAAGACGQRGGLDSDSRQRRVPHVHRCANTSALAAALSSAAALLPRVMLPGCRFLEHVLWSGELGGCMCHAAICFIGGTARLPQVPPPSRSCCGPQSRGPATGCRARWWTG